jgi:hypothetical protein
VFIQKRKYVKGETREREREYIVQGNTKLSPVHLGQIKYVNRSTYVICPQTSHPWHFDSGTKKAVMPKKKVIPARNLKDWTKFTTQ